MGTPGMSVDAVFHFVAVSADGHEFFPDAKQYSFVLGGVVSLAKVSVLLELAVYWYLWLRMGDRDSHVLLGTLPWRIAT